MPGDPNTPYEPSPRLEADVRDALHRAAERVPALAGARLPNLAAPADGPQLVAAAGGDFDAFYTAHRGPIYRALALALADRDLATDAVDRGFAAVYRHRRKRGGDAGAVFREAREWAVGHSNKAGASRGFRLDRHAPVDAEAVAAFNQLAETDRTPLVIAHLLGWQGEAAAGALGVSPESAATLLDDAHSRLASQLGTDAAAAEHRLALALPAEAAAQTVPLSRIESTKGRVWTQRLVAAGAGAAAVLVLIGGVGLGIRLLGDDDVPAGGGGDGGAAVTTPIAAAPIEGQISDLEWVRIPLGPTQGDVSTVAYGPSGFIVMGQSYDNFGSTFFSFTSTDGEVWEPTELPDVPRNGGWINQIVTGDFGYAALGQVYDERAGSDSSIVWTSTDGATWTSAVLPADQEEEVAGIAVRWYTYASSIARTPDGFIVFGNQNADMGDPERFLRDVLPDDVSLFNGWGVTGDRFDVYGPNGQIVFSSTFEDFGLDPEIATLFGNGRQIAWTMDAAGEWTQIETGGLLGVNLGRVVSTDAGLVAVVHQQFGAQLFFSTDGTDWSRVEFERGATVKDAGSIGSTFVALGSVPGSGAAWTSTDGVTWEKTTDPVLSAAYFQQVSSSPNGIAVVASGSAATQADFPPATVSIDGYTITVDTSGFVTVTDDAGTVVAELYSDEVTYGTDGSLTVPDADSDDPLVVVPGPDMARAWEEVYASSIPIEEGPGGPEQMRLLMSADGKAWTEADLTDSIGPGFYPNQVAVGPDVVVMTGWQESFQDSGGPQQPSVWVGRRPGS